MGKSMISEKIRISPYLHREITDLVEDGDFASFSDFVNIAVSSFLSRNFDLIEEEKEDEEEDNISSLEMPVTLLYLALINKGIITQEDMGDLVEKLKNNELDNSIIENFFSGFMDNMIEYDMFDMLDMGKQFEMEKSYEAAEQVYKDIIDKFPEDFEPNFDLGRLYSKLGKKKDSQTQLKIALKKAKEMEEDEEIIEMISSEIKKTK
jgi:Arc/MetJ-type ribon-helix-helix transcriptional regulator